MKEQYKNLIKETELNFDNINQIIDGKINNEEEKIKKVKSRIRNSVIALVIASLIGFSSYAYNHFKKQQDLSFQKSRYYQAAENERLEDILKKVCNEDYELDNIISINKGFNDFFDSTIEKNEIVHFPIGYVENKSLLKDFNNEKTSIISKISDRKSLVDKLISETSKENIDRVYGLFGWINEKIRVFDPLTYDECFKNDALLVIKELSSLDEYINRKLEEKETEIDQRIVKISDSLESNNWNKPGSFEKLEGFILEVDEIKNSYICLRINEKISDVEKIKDSILKTKHDYIRIVENLREDIKEETKNIDKLVEQVKSFFQDGIKDYELESLNDISIKSQYFDDYKGWKDEKLINLEINQYYTELNNLERILNEKFSFAFKSIRNKINKFEDIWYVDNSFFWNNLTKEKVNQLYSDIGELKQCNLEYSIIKNNIFFGGRNNLDDKLKNLEYVMIYNTNEKIKNAESDFLELSKFVNRSEWNSPGTVEIIETIDSKLDYLKKFYFCFSDDKKVSKIKKMSDYVENSKKQYLSLLSRIEQDIKNRTKIAENIIKKVSPLMKNGLQNKELQLIKELKDQADLLKSYDYWKDENMINEYINQYESMKNDAAYLTNKRYNYAMSLLDNQIYEFQKEISYAEKKGIIQDASKRLEYIMENELFMIRYRYYVLESQTGINRTQRLINTISGYL